MRRRGSFRLRWVLLPLAALLLAGAVWLGYRYYRIQSVRVPAAAIDPDAWLEIAPEGAVTGAGEPLTTRIRVGSENKVVVFFYGGGISYDETTASRPYTGRRIDRETGFYADSAENYIPAFCGLGLGSRQPDNPFRDWSIIVIPYTTGDFHVGTGDYAFPTADGGERVLHQHGYTNYRAVMDEALGYIGSAPEELLVAGWSAGGYGAAILAEELMTDYFPEAGHVTVCVDSALLILDNYPEIFREVWQAPEEITEKIRSNNLVVDFLSALYESHGDSVTYLYTGSLRDGALAKYQNYFDTGVFSVSNRSAGLYTGCLREMVRRLREEVPTIGIYLFDRLPFSWLPWMSRLTQHTVLETQSVYWKLSGGRSVISWLNDAVNGRVESVGLGMLR
ncbi:MAG: hypothetical protein IKD79_04930 [Oscillospiraceae bacterium]|nr:hypothetical protein [Oscillospiraceae bacterium]